MHNLLRKLSNTDIIFSGMLPYPILRTFHTPILLLKISEEEAKLFPVLHNNIQIERTMPGYHDFT